MNQSCYAAVPKAGYSDHFVYFAIHHAIEELKAKSHGSVFNTITRETFESTWAAMPPPPLARAFDRLTASLMSRLKNVLEQSRSLDPLRDTLLPKLISGELRVMEADARIAAA